MGTDVFNIAGELKLNVTKFNKKMSEAQKNLNSFTAKSKKAIGKLKKTFKGLSGSVKKLAGLFSLSGVLSGGVLLALGANAQRAAKEIQDLASSTGTTTREIQGLMLAFKNQDLETNDVSDALNTIADRAQDAKEGMQSFIDDFGLVGLEVEDLRGKRPSELFNAFADAVQKTTDPVKRQAALVRILGDELGRKLGPALMEGSKHFKDLTDQAERNGLIMKSGTIKQAELASKAMTGLKNTVLMGVNKAFAQMAPFITAITERLHNLINTSVDFGNVAPTALSAILKPAGMILDAVRVMDLAWDAVKLTLLGFTTAASGAVQLFFKIVAGGANIIKDALLSPLKQALQLASLLPNELGDKAKLALEKINGFEFRPPTIVTEGYESQLEGLLILKREFDEKMNAPPPSENLEAWAEGIRLQSVAIRDTTSALEELRVKTAQRAVESTDLIVAETEALKGAGKARVAAMKEEWDAKIKNSEELGSTLRDQLGTSLSSALDGDFKSIGDSFKNMIKKMVVDAATAQIGDALGLGGGGKGGLGTGGGGGAALMGAVGGLFGFEGGGETGSGARTGGIDGRGGFLSVVHPNETVIDHRKNNAGPIGNSITLNVTMTGSESSGQIKKSAAQLARETKRQLSKV